MAKINVIYGTRSGWTKKVGEFIGEKLMEYEHDVEVIDVSDKKLVKNINFSSLDGIIVGSGIQIGRWTKKMKKFINQYHDQLVKIKPLGIFVSCGTANFKDGIDTACTEYINEFSEKLGLNPDVTGAFGGVYDFSENSNMGKIKMAMVKKIVQSDDHADEFDMNGMNDFRDWDQIASFAKEFNQQLK